MMWWGPALLVHTPLRMWLMQSLTHPPPHPTLPMDTSHKTRSESKTQLYLKTPSIFCHCEKSKMYKQFQSKLLCHIQTFIFSLSTTIMNVKCSGVGAHFTMGILILCLIFMHAHTVCLGKKWCLYRNVIENISNSNNHSLTPGIFTYCL